MARIMVRLRHRDATIAPNGSYDKFDRLAGVDNDIHKVKAKARDDARRAASPFVALFLAVLERARGLALPEPAPSTVPTTPPQRETTPTAQAAVPSLPAPAPQQPAPEFVLPPAPQQPAEPRSHDLFDESSDEEDATCAICLEPLGDAPRMPGCAHRFHAACVLGPDSLASHAWADGVMPSTRRGQRVLCPLCRAPSLIPPGFL